MLGRVDGPMEHEFDGEVVEWRGPAPYWFLRVPVDVSEDIKEAARGIEYWGQVPVVVRIHDHVFTTALFPKDGCYLVPLKVAARRAAGIDVETGAVLRAGLDVGRR